MSKMSRIFDVCVVGAGPAGIFASMALSESCDVLMLELGRRFKERLNCRVINHNQSCSGCKSKCNIITGFGGAFCSQSGGTLSSYPAGSFLLNYSDSLKELLRSYEDALGVWKKFSESNLSFKGSLDEERVLNFSKEVSQIGGTYKHFTGFKIDKETLRDVVRKMEHYLSLKTSIKYESEVVSVERYSDLWHIGCRNGEEYVSRSVLFATGRKGNSYVSKQLDHIGVSTKKTGIDIGIRMELGEGRIDYLSELHPDVKIKFNINGEEV